jgi:hypothetical protein
MEMIDQKMERMAAMRKVLADRVKKHDEMLARWAEASGEPAPTAAGS